MTYSLGVDLGTTFVAAAVARPSGVEMCALGDHGMAAPAVVSVRPDGAVLTGEAAGRRAASRPDLGLGGVKRRLGDPGPIVVGDARFLATTLLGMQLRDVVQTVTEAEGAPPDRIALSCPARWTPARRGLFDEVRSVAGILAPVVVTDAEAAVHHALSGRLVEGEVVAVYDLGGGSFDATLVRRTAAGLEIVGTPDGVEMLGGTDLDDAVLSYVDSVTGGALAGLDRDDAATATALARLRGDCVLAKEALSSDTETVIPVVLPGLHREVRLTRSVLEVIVRAPLEATIAALVRAVDSAGLAPADVGSVLLLGGSSRMPLVADLVSRTFGSAKVIADVHPKHAVALGAAALAAAASMPSLPVRAAPPVWAVPPARTVPAPVPVMRGSVAEPLPRKCSRSVGAWLAVLVALAALALVGVVIPARSPVHPLAPGPSTAAPVAERAATTGAPRAARQVPLRQRAQNGSRPGP